MQRICQSEILPIWSKGSQLRMTSEGLKLQSILAPLARDIRFLWVRPIHFGIPVLPDVRLKKAISSG